MNPTGSERRPRRAIGDWRALLMVVLAALGAALTDTRAAAAEDPMPRPPQLERDVQFWIRVYTQIDTNSGFLHDQYNLGVVYDTLHFAPNSTPSERERAVDAARDRYGAALRRIAEAGEGTLSGDDQHLRDLWGAEGSPARLR